MVFWVFLVIALVLTACFLLQSLAMHVLSGIRLRKAMRPNSHPGALLPELIALEAQFFLAPKRALAETRELLASIDAPPDCLVKVSDQASFSNALQEAQAILSCQSSTLARASRTTPLK